MTSAVRRQSVRDRVLCVLSIHATPYLVLSRTGVLLVVELGCSWCCADCVVSAAVCAVCVMCAG